jgi:sugar-phosphatase
MTEISPTLAAAAGSPRGYAAFLFDMDGTLLDSIAVAVRVWTRWALGHGLDPEPVTTAMHGVRAVETVRRFAPHLDAEAEAAWVTREEIDDVDGVVEIPGAARFLARLPAGRWAVVTSAPRALALRRFAAAGLPEPPVMISGEDVTRGKPAPDGFLAAAAALGVPIGDCLVWEDAPAGIAAAEAAGASVMVVTATHEPEAVPGRPSIAHYDGVTVAADGDGRLVLRTV